MSRITQIVTDWTTSTLRSRIVYARTDCGHSARVTLRPTVLRCMDCGARSERPDLAPAKRCDCGCFSFTVEWHPDPHCADDRITAVGEHAMAQVCGVASPIDLWWLDPWWTEALFAYDAGCRAGVLAPQEHRTGRPPCP
jgi:hypothetical protein